jgi:dihydropyrimidinase
MIALAELLDVPLLIVHVSDVGAIEAIREAQTRGLIGETCPQYFLTVDISRGADGAKWC